jgi:hypothetical protein
MNENMAISLDKFGALQQFFFLTSSFFNCAQYAQIAKYDSEYKYTYILLYTTKTHPQKSFTVQYKIIHTLPKQIQKKTKNKKTKKQKQMTK